MRWVVLLIVVSMVWVVAQGMEASPQCEEVPTPSRRVKVSTKGGWTRVVALKAPYAVVISSNQLIPSLEISASMQVISYSYNTTGESASSPLVTYHGEKHVMESDPFYLFETVVLSDTRFVVAWRKNSRLQATTTTQVQVFDLDLVSLNITAGPVHVPEEERNLMSFFASSIVPAQSVSMAHFPEHSAVVVAGKYSQEFATQADFADADGRSTAGILIHMIQYSVSGSLALTPVGTPLLLSDAQGDTSSLCYLVCFCPPGGLSDFVSITKVEDGYGLLSSYIAQPVPPVTLSPVTTKLPFSVSGTGVALTAPANNIFGVKSPPGPPPPLLPCTVFPDSAMLNLYQEDGVLGELTGLKGAPAGTGHVALTIMSARQNFRVVTLVYQIDVITGAFASSPSPETIISRAPGAFVSSSVGPGDGNYFISYLSSDTTVARVANVTYVPASNSMVVEHYQVSTGASRLMAFAILDPPPGASSPDLVILMTHVDGNRGDSTWAFLTMVTQTEFTQPPPSIALPFEEAVITIPTISDAPGYQRMCFDGDVVLPAQEAGASGVTNMTAVMDPVSGTFTWTPTVSGLYRFSARAEFPLVSTEFTIIVPGRPARPNPPQLVDLSARALRVAWDATNRSTEAPILSFDVQVRYGMGSGLFTDPELVYSDGTAGSVLLENLNPVTVVQARIRARNIVGFGEYSAWGQETTYAECPLGQFLPPDSPFYGPCVACGLDEYVSFDAGGNGGCSPCPITTTAPGGSPFITNCTCRPGFFRPGGAVAAVANTGGGGGGNETDTGGVDCSPCPNGGNCLGATEDPYPARGFFPDPASPQAEFLACLRPAEACPGSNPFRCGPGYEGYLCNTCSEGYYSDSSQRCKPCGSGAAVFFAFVIIAIVVTSMLIVCCVLALPSNAAWRQEETKTVTRSRKVPHSLSVGLVFAQVVSVLQQTKFDQPQSVNSFLSVFRVFAMDPNLVASECAVDSFEAKYLVTLLVPVLMLAIMAGTAFAIRLGLAVANIDTNMNPLTVMEQIVFILGPLLYLPMSRSAILIFDCSELPDGTFGLDADLGFSCFSGPWFGLALIGLLGILLYVIALPAYIGWRLAQNREILFSSISVFNRYGSVYAIYRQRFFYFELVMLLKRLGIVTISLFFSELPTWMATLFILLFFSFALFHARFHPFYLPAYNSLELSLNVALVAVVILFYTFYADTFKSDASRGFFIFVTIAIVCACLLLIAYAVALEMKDIGSALLARSKMSASATDDSKTALFVLPDVARNEMWREFDREYALEMHNQEEVRAILQVRARFDTIRSEHEERIRRGTMTMSQDELVASGLGGTVVDRNRNSVRLSTMDSIAMDDLDLSQV